MITCRVSLCSFFTIFTLQIYMIILTVYKSLYNPQQENDYETKKKLNELSDKETECDLIIVHRKFGIILVETKSSFGEYKKAQAQLEKATYILLRSKYFNLSPKASMIIKKVVAFPSLKPHEIGYKGGENYVSLWQPDISSERKFTEWWDINVANKTNLYKICKNTYYVLVPKLLCGRCEFCFCYDIVDKLDKQKSLKRLIDKEAKIKRENTVHAMHARKAENAKKKQ